MSFDFDTTINGSFLSSSASQFSPRIGSLAVATRIDAGAKQGES